MALQEALVNLSFVAGVDLTNFQFRFMGLVNGNIQIPDPGFPDMPIGVLQNNPASGQAATVSVSGRMKVVAGGAITAGAQITANAQGQAIVAASANPIFGKALTAAAAAGELVEVLFRYEGVAP